VRVWPLQVSEVGLGGEVLAVPTSHKGVSRRLIYTSAHGLVELPSSLSWLFRTRLPFSGPLLPTVLTEIFRPRRKGTEDESVYDFISRRLGNEIADYVIDPMCRGIFAGSARGLSMRSAFPAIHQYEASHGTVVGGALMAKPDPLPDSAPELVKQAVREKWAIYTLRSGLQSLPLALLSALEERGVKVHLETPCTAIHFRDQSAQVVCGDSVLETDHVISAIPSHALPGLLSEDLSPLSQHLLTIPSVTVGVVCLEFKGRVLPPQYEEAFGYLVPSHQPASILGVIFDSSTFPQHNRPDLPSTRCTVMLGGEWFDTLGDDPGNIGTDDIIRIALDSMRDHLGVTDEPSNMVARIHQNCIAQYQLGHSQKLDTISKLIQEKAVPLSLVGMSYHGVSVNDCVHNSFTAVDRLLAQHRV
jgi:oxygen-dependent protoporphyrinogen oxidase